MMDELIAYISELFGLKITSKIALSDMERDVGEIRDMAGYIEFLKSNYNNYDLNYQTVYQKFLTVTKWYKAKESKKANAERDERLKSSAEKLADKVRKIDTLVLDSKMAQVWEGFRNFDGGDYFTDRERRALYAIGNPLECVRLQRSHSGRDPLCESLEKLFIERADQKEIENKKNKIIENKKNTNESSSIAVLSLAKNKRM